ncbi:MAG: ATP-binding protein [Candidatus Limnocylindrales bacterium]
MTETGSTLAAASSASQGDGSTHHAPGDRAPADAFALDASLRYTSFNTAHAARLRVLYGSEAALGGPMLDCVTVEADREKIAKLLVRALGGEEVVEDAEPAVGRQGSGAFRLSLSPIRDGGEIVGVTVLAEDITDRRRADAYQQRLNRELRAIKRCNEVLVRATEEQALLDEICRIICDDAGYQMAWVGYVEHDEAKLVRPVASAGTFPGELESSGITWAETPRGMGPTGMAARTGRISFIQNLESDPLAEPWREDARRYGRRAAVALPLTDEEGVTFGALSICTMDETFSAEEIRLLEELAGDLAYGIGTIRARAAQRELEAQLRQSQKMEVVGQLAGGIAHDFNNLLTAIRGYGELLAGELLPSQTAARNDVAEVLAAVDRAEVLTRGLLAFSRRQVLQPRTVVPGEVVERIVPLLRRLLGEQVELVPELRCDTGSARVDPGQLEQVIVNLAVNARDAMPGGGRLSIGTGLLDAGPDDLAGNVASGPGTYIVLTVTDTGIGMDAATQTHLFEPFFTTKAEGKGTGLGLATVYGIVRQSGGFITVRSAPGEGSEFRVNLPQVDASAPSGRPFGVQAPPPPEGSGTVLLVEDDPAVRTFAARALDQLGYRVLVAPAASDALDLLAAQVERVDLVLSDIVMPGMQGPELARRVRESRPEVRFLFMSGFADGEGGQADLVGGQPILPKPFAIHDLAVAVRDAVAR